MDSISQQKRSKNMAAIRSKNTSPEILVRKKLFSKGFRYRLYFKELPGKPDLFLKQYNVVIFINGCFWHGHKGCKIFHIPKTHYEFWKKKIERNRKRDCENITKLINMGLRVLVIWECSLHKKYCDQTVNLICNWIISKAPSSQIFADLENNIEPCLEVLQETKNL